jgi:hypothetical protein
VPVFYRGGIFKKECCMIKLENASLLIEYDKKESSLF